MNYLVNIIYRHFREGDEPQLADLFNRAFQMNGGGVIRTPKVVHWRYPQSPNWDPEQIQIAEDTDKQLIVGAIYVSLVEMVPINGKDYLIADINDVSCHPEYTGRGIARKLMENGIEYMKKIGCDFSLLDADFNGFPRKRIYSKMGYQDIERALMCIHLPSIPRLVKDMPIAISLCAPLLINTYIPRFINRLKLKINPFFKDFSYEIKYNQAHIRYMKAINKIMPKYYNGFVPYTIERLKWARVIPPVKRFKPTFIIIKKGKEIIGGGVITHQNMYAFKYGIKIRLGIIHELFLDKNQFKDAETLRLGYIYLLDKVIRAATKRFIGVLIHQVSPKDIHLKRGIRETGFFIAKGPAVMLKPVKEGIIIPKMKKPLFIPCYVSLGIP